MITEFNSICLECNEPIFNPICHECLSKEIREWIRGYKRNKKLKKIEKEVKKFIQENKKYGKNKTKCIKCCKKNVFICPYCFTELIYKKLKQLKIKKSLLSEFLVLFNFDFEHTGYYNDLEKIEQDF